MAAMAESQPQPRLLDEVRRVLRLHHYSIHTERSYLQWVITQRGSVSSQDSDKNAKGERVALFAWALSPRVLRVSMDYCRLTEPD